MQKIAWNGSWKSIVIAEAAGNRVGSVTQADIAAAISAAGGPKVDKRRIELDAPIKSLGAHSASVRLHPEVDAKVSIEVVAA